MHTGRKSPGDGAESAGPKGQDPRARPFQAAAGPLAIATVMWPVEGQSTNTTGLTPVLTPCYCPCLFLALWRPCGAIVSQVAGSRCGLWCYGGSIPSHFFATLGLVSSGRCSWLTAAASHRTPCAHPWIDDRACPPPIRGRRSAEGHLGVSHGRTAPVNAAALSAAGPVYAASNLQLMTHAHRAKVPGRWGRECRPERAGPPCAAFSGGRGAARHSNSYVASGGSIHQHNGAYSRTDALLPLPFFLALWRPCGAIVSQVACSRCGLWSCGAMAETSRPASSPRLDWSSLDCSSSHHACGWGGLRPPSAVAEATHFDAPGYAPTGQRGPRPDPKGRRSAEGHLGVSHGRTAPVNAAALSAAGPVYAASNLQLMTHAHRAKVPGRWGRECRPERAGPPCAAFSGGRGAARHSNSYVASGGSIHQHNGAYSRTDALLPFRPCVRAADVVCRSQVARGDQGASCCVNGLTF